MEVERHYYLGSLSTSEQTAGGEDYRPHRGVLLQGKTGGQPSQKFKTGYIHHCGWSLPRSHLEHLKWKPELLLNWAAKTGPATEEQARIIMQSRPHLQQGFSSMLGIMGLAKTRGDHRVEAACRRTLTINAKRIQRLQTI